jgi:hypothetical protein
MNTERGEGKVAWIKNIVRTKSNRNFKSAQPMREVVERHCIEGKTLLEGSKKDKHSATLGNIIKGFRDHKFE